jgi:hypothetical protein
VNKTVLVLVAAGAIGVGVFLYVRRARASTGPSPAGGSWNVPDRVAEKRYAGAAIASTSDAYNPSLPPAAQVAIDRGTSLYKTGTDLVSQGKATAAAAKSGDIGGALTAAGSAYTTGAGLFGGSTAAKSPPPAAAPAASYTPKAGVDFRAPTTIVTPSARTVGGVSSVRDSAGNVFDPGKYGATPEFQKLRAAADAAERKANVGAGHF